MRLGTGTVRICATRTREPSSSGCCMATVIVDGKAIDQIPTDRYVAPRPSARCNAIDCGMGPRTRCSSKFARVHVRCSLSVHSVCTTVVVAYYIVR